MYRQLNDYQQLSDDYERIEQAIRYIELNFKSQPSLNDISKAIGLSEFHFQRLFTQWVGISPKRFLQFLTKEHARELLEKSTNLLDTAYDSGLSGPGRLHDLFVTTEAVTPGEYKYHGEGLVIRFGIHPSPFGRLLVALTDRGICFLAFVNNDNIDQSMDELAQRYQKAEIHRDQIITSPLAEKIFAVSQGYQSLPLQLHLIGTNFQIKVWEALLRVPPGRVVSYEYLAMAIGEPNAARAVGNAVGFNPIPLLIPCHRVIRKVGEFGKYRYGSARKKAMLGWEMSQHPEIEVVQ
jgi:AraC family transcriptional regulator of adaptative response/methylated-DNA-[protein]-cysteine methyltransferase